MARHSSRTRRSWSAEATAELERWSRRARRATVLRPWHGECLVLRAADTRLPVRTVARRTGQPRGQRGPGETVERDRDVWRIIDTRQGDCIGLWRALEELRAATWRGRAQEAPRRPSGQAREPVEVGLVRIDAALVRRACRWPRLPRRCTITEAARRLGVSREAIRLWLKEGKLAARPARGPRLHPRTRVYVDYAATSRLLQRMGGPRVRHPDGARRLWCDEPNPDWVVERFRRERRRHLVVRVVRLVGSRGGGPLRRQAVWVCPTCGAEAVRLYLPAGPMAWYGRTWSPWRFQCPWCTGVASEAKAWSAHASDGINRWALKLSCGSVSGNDWRRGVAMKVPRDLFAQPPRLPEFLGNK